MNNYKIGDTLRLIRPFGLYKKEGMFCKIINIVGDSIIIAPLSEVKTENYICCIPNNEFEKYFTLVKDTVDNKVYTLLDNVVEGKEFSINFDSNKELDFNTKDILNKSKFIIYTTYKKNTIVSCQLPNGFVITKSSACVCPIDHDIKVALDICLKDIIKEISTHLAYINSDCLPEECEECIEDNNDWDSEDWRELYF